MAALRVTLRKVAPHKATVLILGESGTGKEWSRGPSRALPRAAAPFVAVNCGAMPAGLIESELFGHLRGAFTGRRSRPRGPRRASGGRHAVSGRDRRAARASQVKLLRVLQDGHVRRLGADADVVVDVRVVAATSARARGRGRRGQVPERICCSGSTSWLCSCRSARPRGRRRLAGAPFLAGARARLGAAVSARDIAPDALAALEAYAWPGNVRELENTMERAAVLCEGDAIDAASLPSASSRRPDARRPHPRRPRRGPRTCRSSERRVGARRRSFGAPSSARAETAARRRALGDQPARASLQDQR